eukprot:7699792-Karenia_brevis.AAC.1
MWVGMDCKFSKGRPWAQPSSLPSGTWNYGWAEVTAVIRALLHVQATGQDVTRVTMWSDSKVVVQ